MCGRAGRHAAGARRAVRTLLERSARLGDVVSGHLIKPAGVARLRRWNLLDAVLATGCPPGAPGRASHRCYHFGGGAPCPPGHRRGRPQLRDRPAGRDAGLPRPPSGHVRLLHLLARQPGHRHARLARTRQVLRHLPGRGRPRTDLRARTARPVRRVPPRPPPGLRQRTAVTSRYRAGAAEGSGPGGIGRAPAELLRSARLRSFPALACGCAIVGPASSGALGAELAKKAAVVGCDVLFGDSPLFVEAEDVHEVHDDTGTGGFEEPGG